MIRFNAVMVSLFWIPFLSLSSVFGSLLTEFAYVVLLLYHTVYGLLSVFLFFPVQFFYDSHVLPEA